MTETFSPAERDRVLAARQFVHKATCPGRGLDAWCAACPSGLGTLYALRALDENPRDARAARRALHDAVCTSGCGADSEHADRTQAKAAAALRKFHRGETP